MANNFTSRPEAQFELQPAQKWNPRWSHRRPPPVRHFADVPAMQGSASYHCCHAPCLAAPCLALLCAPTPFRSGRRALPPSLLVLSCMRGHSAMAATKPTIHCCSSPPRLPRSASQPPRGRPRLPLASTANYRPQPRGDDLWPHMANRHGWLQPSSATHVPRLRTSSSSVVCGIAFSTSRCTSCAPSSVASVAGAARPPRDPALVPWPHAARPRRATAARTAATIGCAGTPRVLPRPSATASVASLQRTASSSAPPCKIVTRHTGI
jgi:hypothetical protein